MTDKKAESKADMNKTIDFQAFMIYNIAETKFTEPCAEGYFYGIIASG